MSMSVMLPMSTVAVKSHNVWVDLARVFLVFVPAAFVVALTIFVIISYFKAYRIDKFKGARRGLLPHHVWMIGVSYLLLLANGIWSTIDRVGAELSPHFLLLSPAFILGVIALWVILKFERLRYSAEAPTMREITAEDLPQV